MKELLRNSLVATALLSATLSASAVSVDDLLKANNPSDPDMCYAMDVMNTPRLNSISGRYNFAYGYASSGEVKIYRTNYDNCINVEGLIRGNIKISFRVVGNTIYSVDGSNNDRNPYKQYTLNTKPVSGGTADWPGMVFQVDEAYYSNYYGKYLNSYADSWTGTITTYADRYEISMNPFQFLLSNSSYMGNSEEKFFDGLLILIPRVNYNAVVNDQLKGVNREYPATVNFDTNKKTFYMENFACSGLAINTSEIYDGVMESTLTGINGTVVPTNLWEGEIRLPDQQVQGDVITTYIGYQLAQIHERVRIYPNGGSLGQDVVGTYKINYVNHVEEDRWHKKDGGNLVTLRQTSINLGDYRMRSADGRINLEPWYNTKMEVTDTVTANPTFNSAKLVTSDGFFATRTYINEEQEQYVDHYEIVIVPGIHNTIASSEEFYHQDHGHNRAFNISELGYENEYDMNRSNAPALATERGTYVNKMFHTADLKDAGWTDSEIEAAKHGAATIYIKTVYNNESGLEPSFHALTTPNTATGVEEVIAGEGDAVVTAANGTITINGSDAVAEVYTAAGAQVYAGLDREIAVAPGLYIVRVGSTVAKLIVR